MKWTKDHDQQLLREILAGRPFEYPKGSRQIGAVWQTILDNLNSKTEVCFNLTNIRAGRERYSLLEAKFKKSIKNEMKQSGVNSEPTEFELAMEDIASQFANQEEIARREKEANDAAHEKNKKEAEDVRRTAMETFRETKKRATGEGDDGSEASSSGPKKRRSNVMEYLQKTSESEIEFKKQDLEVKKMEIELRKHELEAQKVRDDSMLQALLSLAKRDK